jgi:acyl-CoA synthetase (AMP-forming)/AMP-acid ligase II
MINVGGRKMSPLEIEQSMLTHPAVAYFACTGIEESAGLTRESVAVVVSTVVTHSCYHGIITVDCVSQAARSTRPSNRRSSHEDRTRYAKINCQSI